MNDKPIVIVGSAGGVEAARKAGLGSVLAMASVVIDPNSFDSLFPDPKPPKELTDDDHHRLQAAEERRKRRAAKWAGRG